jgi:hypothetical protein
MEVVWSPARILVQARVPSGDGARWSAVVVCLLLWLPWIFGFAPSGDPRPDLAWRKIWRIKMLKPVMMLTSSTAMAEQGGGSVELRSVDFPSVQGSFPIQGYGEVVRRRAGAAFWSLPLASRSRGTNLYFSFVSGLFCKNRG